MDKLKEVLEEEELIKRIASLPDKESRERVLQAIEDMEKRERIRKRVEELRMKMKEERLRPIDREVITSARWTKRLAPIFVAIWVFIWLLIAVIVSLPPFILIFVILGVLVAIGLVYFSQKWYDEVVEKYYNKDTKD